MILEDFMSYCVTEKGILLRFYRRFQTTQQFFGRVYVKGRAEDEDCSSNFFSANATRKEPSIVIHLGACGMQRFRSV